MFMPEQAPQTLASILGINCHPSKNGRIIDFELWKICFAAIKSFNLSPKGLDFINLGYDLTKELKERSSSYCVGDLVSPSVCSFVPSINSESLRNAFGIEKQLPKIDELKKFNYYGVRFAEEYWLWVSRVATSHSIEACSNFFCLKDKLLVDLVANASSREILDFCFSNPQLIKFNLTCQQSDCLRILKLQNYRRDLKTDFRLRVAQAKKFNHSSYYSTGEL